MARLTFTAVLIITLVSSTAWAYPLRIWVMHNEPAVEEEDITRDRIERVIDRWRTDEGIFIENSVQNLITPREQMEDLTFAKYIIGDNELLNQLVQFKREQPDHFTIAVEFLRWNDAFDRLVSALSSDDYDSAPDVIQVGSTWIASFADSGLLADITDRIDTKDFFPPSIASARIDGKDRLYAAPWFVDTRLLFFNKQYIESTEQVANWESFFKTGKRLKELHDKYLIGFQEAISWDLLHNLMPWLWASGGGILDYGRVVLDQPSSLDGMRYLKRLATAGYADFPPLTQESAENKFLQGDYATIIAGPWLIKRMGANWQQRYGIALPPAGPAGSIPFVGGSHLAVSEASKARGNFTQAVSLIRHLTAPPAQVAFSNHTGLPPANRKALERYLGGHDVGAYRQALEHGRSYPSIPEWGSVVENEMIRSHLWHIWRNIAQGAPDQTIAFTATRAANELRKKLWLSFAVKHALSGSLLLGFVMLLGLGGIFWWRCRYTNMHWQFEQKSRELIRIDAERTLLEGKVLVLERYRERQSNELSALTDSLCQLEKKSLHLRKQLSQAKADDTRWHQKNIGSFSFGSDGSLFLDDKNVHFENNRQAHRLIEFMIRQACQGITTTHCLWGYVLFGWDPHTIKTPPQRLFETMVSKINAPLKSRRIPPLIKRAGKKTGMWKFNWDPDTVVEHSDIKRSMDAVGNAAEALMLDPHNDDAAEQLTHHAQPGDSRTTALLRIHETSIREKMDRYHIGIRTLDEMIAIETLPRGIDPDTAHDELRVMKYQLEYLEKRFDAVHGDADDRRPFQPLDHISNGLTAVQHEIASLKARETDLGQLWASVLEGNNFMRLMSYPQMQTLIHNVYHHDTREREDPRLVQLALIYTLSKTDALQDIQHIRSEERFFGKLGTVIRAQLKELECHLQAIGPC